MDFTPESVSNALINRAIHFDYQPILELSSRKLIGYEALTRWQGWSTEQTIYAIESNELCPLWVSCQLTELSKIIPELAEPLFISLNLGHDSLVEPFVIKKLNLFKYPHRLQIEILESVNLDENSLSFLQKLNDKIVVKADDIGFRFPWLNRLVGKFAAHFDGIKICKDLTSNMMEDARAAAACRYLIAYANDFGLDTTAEWVQTEAQAERLQQYGCMNGQGKLFGLGGPLPI